MEQLSEQLAVQIDRPFTFTRRPIPIAPDLRPAWKIALLLLILDITSRGGKSSVKRLHVLNWAVRSPAHRASFDQAHDNDSPLFGFRFRFDPILSRAIDLADGEGLVEWVNGNRIQLTPDGRHLAKAIQADKDAMTDERQFLAGLGKRLTEGRVADMISLRGR